MNFFVPNESKPVTLGEQSLHCHICRHDRLWQREVQLNTAAATP